MLQSVWGRGRKQYMSVLYLTTCTNPSQNFSKSMKNPRTKPHFVLLRMSRARPCCSLSGAEAENNTCQFSITTWTNLSQNFSKSMKNPRTKPHFVLLRMSRARPCCSLSGAEEAENNSPAAANCKICRNAKSTKLQSWQRADAAINTIQSVYQKSI